MSMQYDEKGKIYTDLVPKLAIHAIVQTTTQQVRGNVHVRAGERLKDELDRDELFLAMTEVSVLAPDGELQFQAPFLAVRRAQIVWVFPDQGEPGAG
ncbi:MAG TPA: hypothetical protein VMJ64_04655 [Anaerolineales bacterium]|nr:hypothetical protein [Anaerolineales bacterium]